MRIKEVCLLLAKRYRKRAKSTFFLDKSSPRGICGVIGDMKRRKEITFRQRNKLDKLIDKLPPYKFGSAYKFPIDKTGFLLRAKWLEKISKKFR